MRAQSELNTPIRASARDVVPISKSTLVRRICLAILLVSMLLSRVAIPLGDKQIPISFFFGLCGLGLIAFINRASLSATRLLAVGLVSAVIIAETVFVHRTSS